MKYFEIKLDSDNYVDAPRLINWYKIQDVRLIRWETYHKLKNRLIYNIDSSEYIVSTDIISFPFLLVSPMVRETIKMYGDKVVFKETILLNVEKDFEQVYYLPVMEESEQIKLSYVGKNESYSQKEKVPEWAVERNIFWVRKKEKRHTIISLDLAESLLRRNAIGVELKEVFLSECSIG